MRLVCYHLFHWSCLDAYCRSLPPDTAPAGYLCPVAGCNCQIFPPDNLVSPVADKLRSVLQVTTMLQLLIVRLPKCLNSLTQRVVMVVWFWLSP